MLGDVNRSRKKRGELRKMAYSTIDDVLEATGMTLKIVQDLGDKTEEQVNTMIDGFIAKAEGKIKGALGVPITIRKEYHKFEKNNTLELGPYEDEFEFFSSYNPEDCVEKIYAIYWFEGKRIKLPYPRDCDKLTEDVIDMDSIDCTLTKEESIVKCGLASIKAEFLVGGKFGFPKNANLNKFIYSWNYIGFWFRTDDTDATFTITLSDKDGNTETQTFTLTFADTWEIVALKMSDFVGSIDWKTTKLQKIEIGSDKACTIYFDNFNFNDSYFWTYPEGLICWSNPSSNPFAQIEVTYSYDPYKNSTPDVIVTASSRMAGVYLMDFLIGCRQRISGFQQMADTLDPRPDRETLEITRARLLREAQSCLASIGYKTYEGMG